MSQSADLLNQQSHFAFGKNWASYSEGITELEINEAVTGLARLAGPSLAGRRFLDIGSGSGLHALAALRLGATEVVALDIDPDSVATTRKLLTEHAQGGNWRAEQMSVFEATEAKVGTFDVVYSWGVLHHTGDMYRALRCAAALVREGGEFQFALYYKTWMCGLWKIEKRWYTSASVRAQKLARNVWVGAFRLAYPIIRRKRFATYVAQYGKGRRGMDFYHDVHDWMGGWPYESATSREISRFMRGLGMEPEPTRQGPVVGMRPGFFGSGCQEYVYRRIAPAR
jgi:2-polyprenyl-3-methyl-5-hydroxy-6-metoxy-1,4-benzoquinol methylase